VDPLGPWHIFSYGLIMRFWGLLNAKWARMKSIAVEQITGRGATKGVDREAAGQPEQVDTAWASPAIPTQ
jgi:hypothetical protein